MKKFHWDSLFTDVFTLDAFEGRPSPKERMLRCGIERWNLKPEESIMVGDTPEDIRSGKKVGMRTLGIVWGYSKKENVLEAVPDWVSYSSRDLLPILEKL